MMGSNSPPTAEDKPVVSPDALLCSLVIAPGTFPRNRYFRMYQDPVLKRTRRRAYHVRSVLKQLLAKGLRQAEIIGRLELNDNRVLLRYKVPGLGLQRTTAFSAMESAALNYALERAGHAYELSDKDRAMVEAALASLASSST